MTNAETVWCGVAVVFDESVPPGEIAMPLFNEDAEQRPEFRVGEDMMLAVSGSLEDYEQILSSRIAKWQARKQCFMQELGRGAVPLFG